jgi:lantibiotic modifying enzyme
VLPDRNGVAWNRTEGGRLSGGFWCHGAAGIGHFFLHAARLELIGQAEELANRAAITVQHTMRCALPTLCHGLAGNLGFLQEMHRETGNRLYLDGVRTFDRLLQTWLVERDSRLVCAGDAPTVFSPSYMTGYAGVAVSLRRLAVPGDLPDLARPWLVSDRSTIAM